MANRSPVEPPSAGGYASGSGASEEGRSPLSLGLGILKSLTEKKSARADGQPAKRRGPKPDSKPALTRRQELNRQAQRTHRERKELYIKALEQEVLRLKESFSSMAQDKDRLAEENRQLKALLAQHGIAWKGTGGVDEYQAYRGESVGYTSSTSSHAPASSPSVYSPQGPSGAASTIPSPHHTSISPAPTDPSKRQPAPATTPGMDLDQTGIDFVLTLERPCMDHMQIVVQGSDAGKLDFCGHALMASCPPYPDDDVVPGVPFGHGNSHGSGTAQKTWDVSRSDLSNLMDLSKRLNLDGEITPVMAWGMILGHARMLEMTSVDVQNICIELGGKVRCYGFGAVLEEFEVRDALDRIFFARA